MVLLNPSTGNGVLQIRTKLPVAIEVSSRNLEALCVPIVGLHPCRLVG